MATQLAGVLRHLHRLANAPDNPEWSDEQLLHRFLAERDESAFRLLMERHGRMVLSVCQHVLRQQQDAEDAFQATFLVLAQGRLHPQGDRAGQLALRRRLSDRAQSEERGVQTTTPREAGG